MSIELKNVSFKYNQNNSIKKYALKNINLKIEKNEFIGVIGHTGSGKSTLVQLLNGLLYPTEGSVTVDGQILSEKEKSKLKNIRQNVGLVFQYPEYQLFEETIYLDIAFGPKNLNLSDDEIDKRVKYAMELVGLDFEKYKDVSPFDLSGGQKRRVAIAGVLAMKPKYLILDEPTAGLDPRGRDEILLELKNIFEKSEEMTILVVSHSMEDIAKIAKRVIVMSQGDILYDDTPENVYSNKQELESIGLDVPQITTAIIELSKKGYKFDKTIVTVEDAFNSLITQIGGLDG